MPQPPTVPPPPPERHGSLLHQAVVMSLGITAVRALFEAVALLVGADWFDPDVPSLVLAVVVVLALLAVLPRTLRRDRRLRAEGRGRTLR